MKSLQVREVPDHIYNKLLQESKKEHRSLSQQTIATLAQGLDTPLSPKTKRRELLLKIEETDAQSEIRVTKSPVEIIRADRER